MVGTTGLVVSDQTKLEFARGRVLVALAEIRAGETGASRVSNEMYGG